MPERGTGPASLCLRPTGHVFGLDSGLRPLFHPANLSAYLITLGRGWPIHGQVGNPSIRVLSMTAAHSTAEVLSDHVALELACPDRLHGYACVPRLRSEAGPPYFLREIRCIAHSLRLKHFRQNIIPSRAVLPRRRSADTLHIFDGLYVLLDRVGRPLLFPLQPGEESPSIFRGHRQ